MSRVIIIVLAVALLGAGGMAFLQSRKAAALQDNLQTVRAESAAVSVQLENQHLENRQLQQQVERLRTEVDELPALRGEVTRLQSRSEDLEAQLARARQSAEAVQSRLQAMQTAVASAPASDGPAEIPLSQAPAHIRNRLAQQYPGANVTELVKISEDGRTMYAVEGVSENEREFGAVLDENGEILEQRIEMRFREVPDPVRGAVARQFNRDGGIDMTQVWDNGRTTYRGNVENNGQEMHFVFSETGELIRYEAWTGEGAD